MTGLKGRGLPATAKLKDMHQNGVIRMNGSGGPKVHIEELDIPLPTTLQGLHTGSQRNAVVSYIIDASTPGTGNSISTALSPQTRFPFHRARVNLARMAVESVELPSRRASCQTGITRVNPPQGGGRGLDIQLPHPPSDEATWL